MSFPEPGASSGASRRLLTLGLVWAVACVSPPPDGGAVGQPSPTEELAPVRSLSSGTGRRLQAIDPGDGRVLWASGVGGTVVRSSDGGESWSPIVVGGAEDLELRDVEALDPDTAFALAAGPGDRSRIYGTDDAGATWRELWRNPLADGFYDCLDLWPSGRGIAFSDSVDGALWRVARDGGGAWTAAAIQPPARAGEGGFAASGTCLVTGAEGEAWLGTGAGGAARVFATTDGGDAWDVVETPVFAGGEAAGILSLALDEAGGLFAFGGDIADPASRGARVARSRDRGRSWELVAEPAFPGAIYGGAARGGGDRAELIAVGPGGAAYSADAGASWRPVDPRSWWAVAFSPTGAAFLVGPEGRLATWSPP